MFKRLIQTFSYFPTKSGGGVITITTTGTEAHFYNRLITKTLKIYYPRVVGDSNIYISYWDTRRDSRNKEKGWTLQRATSKEIDILLSVMV